VNVFRGIAFFVISIVLARETAAQPMDLGLRIPERANLGEALPAALTFSNQGGEPLYLQFSGADYGGESLVICAQREGVWFRTGQIHFDRDVAARRFDFIALRPQQIFESPILGVNDPAADSLPILRLTEPGAYEVFARYTSRGSTEEGVLWPIWRGVAVSPVQRITLEPPSPSSLDEQRRALATCAGDVHDCEASLIGYFRVVRDDRAANILIEMLDHTDVPIPSLVEAVANQIGAKTRKALDRFVKRFPSHSQLVNNLLSPDHESIRTLCLGK
jgi:hypothetical protein